MTMALCTDGISNVKRIIYVVIAQVTPPSQKFFCQSSFVCVDHATTQPLFQYVFILFFSLSLTVIHPAA